MFIYLMRMSGFLDTPFANYFLIKVIICFLLHEFVILMHCNVSL